MLNNGIIVTEKNNVDEVNSEKRFFILLMIIKL